MMRKIFQLVFFLHGKKTRSNYLVVWTIVPVSKNKEIFHTYMKYAVYVCGVHNMKKIEEIYRKTWNYKRRKIRK